MPRAPNRHASAACGERKALAAKSRLVPGLHDKAGAGGGYGFRMSEVPFMGSAPIRAITFTATAWVDTHGAGKYWGVTLPFDVADEFDAMPLVKGGWGSVKIIATIGGTSWSTSLFPSKESQSFMMLLNKKVITAEGITEGGTVTITADPVR
jgi:hypothetical protein